MGTVWCGSEWNQCVLWYCWLVVKITLCNMTFVVKMLFYCKKKTLLSLFVSKYSDGVRLFRVNITSEE